MPENDVDPYSASSHEPEGEDNPQPSQLSTYIHGHLAALVDPARADIETSGSDNTRRAYASDWKHFSGWCRRQGLSALPPDPRTVGC